jgi:hypothetical protein
VTEDLNRFPHPADVAPSNVPVFTVDRNVGHGRVFPRPDGRVQKCGGPALCRECQADEGKRETAEALWSGADDRVPEPSGRPEFNREVVKAFKGRGEAFPSTDGRLWTRAVLGSAGVLCAWDRDGTFHLWGPVEEIAAKAAGRG